MGYGSIGKLRYYAKCILEVIYGSNSNCTLCGEYTEEVLCKGCKDKIKYEFIYGTVKKEGRSMEYYSCSYYNSVVKEMIIRLKYKSDFDSGKVLAELMGKLIKENNISADYISFIPSDEGTLKKRGFNQSEYLCKVLNSLTGKPIVDCLTKGKPSKDQIGLDGEARWSNLENCFTVKNNNGIKGKKILLIDDVITTGATGFYCGEALLKFGCSKVNILTVAKSTI